jgi:chromosome segregation ATPase
MGDGTMPKAIIRGLVGYNGRLMDQLDELQNMIEALVSGFLVWRLYSVPNNTIHIVDLTKEEIATQTKATDELRAHLLAASRAVTTLTTENTRLRRAMESMTATWKQKPSDGRQTAAMAQEIANLNRTCTKQESKIRDLQRQLAAAKEVIALAGEAANQAKALRGAMRAEKRNAVTIEFVNVAKKWLDDAMFADIMKEAKHRVEQRGAQ